MLRDNYSRKISYLRLSITDRCNLRCRYCMPEEGVKWISHDQVMRHEEFLRCIRLCASLGIDKIRITGGEPLVRKGIVGFISDVNKIENLKDISMTTNGVLLKEFAKDLRNAGLNRINISLDTLDRKKFEYIARVDAFDDVWNGVLAAIDAGFNPVKINAVAMKGLNDDEIVNLAALTKELPVQIRFIEMMPIGCAARLGNDGILESRVIIEKIKKSFGELERLSSGKGPAQLYKIKNSVGSVGVIEPISDESFCSRCNRIRLSASGSLIPCLYSGEYIDLVSAMRGGTDDEGLKAIILKAVKEKPRMGAHRAILEKSMNSIGG